MQLPIMDNRIPQSIFPPSFIKESAFIVKSGYLRTPFLVAQRNTKVAKIVALGCLKLPILVTLGFGNFQLLP